MLQCVITVPDERSQTSASKQHTLCFDDRSVHLSNVDGTTVVFDSFSSEEERRQWSPLIKSVSKLKDPSRHFFADWNIRVSSRLSAILGPETIAAYRTVDRKPTEAPKRSVVTTDFDDEIQELKRHCAMLSNETSSFSKQQRYRSTAEALLSMNQAPGSFADVLRGNQPPAPSSQPPEPRNDEGSSQSSETPTVCMSPPGTHNDEMSVAVSALCAFGKMM